MPIHRQPVQSTLDLAIPRRDSQRTLWLGAATRRPIAGIAGLLSGSPVLIDGLSGAPVVAGTDVLLLRSDRSQRYGVFRRASTGVDRTRLMAEVETWIDAADLSAETGGIREILIVGFGPGRAGRYVPPGSTTALERTFMALRHEDVRCDHAAVLALGARLKRGLPDTTHPSLRGVVEREEADALMRGGLGEGLAKWRYRAADAFFTKRRPLPADRHIDNLGIQQS